MTNTVLDYCRDKHTLGLRPKNASHNHFYADNVMKRAFDVVVAGIMLGLSLPFFLLSAMAVRFTSKGPVLFKQPRWGRDGVLFHCLKLRTMVADAEDWLSSDPDLKAMHKENGFKLSLDEDPRVTVVGQLLRKTRIDELPQLLNVIRGDMSLVGPRPIVAEELEWYGDTKEEYLSVRPGIFGAWTAQGGRRVDYPARVLVELDYVRNQSIIKDILVLAQHIPVLIVGLTQGLRLGCSMIYNQVSSLFLFRKIFRNDLDRVA